MLQERRQQVLEHRHQVQPMLQERHQLVVEHLHQPHQLRSEAKPLDHAHRQLHEDKHLL